MKAAYDALQRLMADKGYESKGIVYEIYFNSPMDTPPAELKTMILFPLKGD